MRGRTVIPMLFVYPQDVIFASVKEETSRLAIRRQQDAESSVFDLLVFDEDYMDKFKILFEDAQAEVLQRLQAFMKHVPAGNEGPVQMPADYNQDRDFSFVLAVSDNFNFHLTKAVNTRISQFITAYICYRWFEFQLPDVATSYITRAEDAIENAKAMLNSTVRPVRRRTGMWW
jgi:hypothetical protein